MWIAIEGNIGSGKSTLIRLLSSEGYRCIPEPVHQWQSIIDHDTGDTLLSAFYHDPPRYSYLFQSYTFPTRMQHMREIERIPANEVIITERTIDTDYNIFGKAAIANGFMNSLEAQVYQSWYQFHRQQFSLTPDLIVYLNTPAIECLQRIERREREGESNIDILYLIQLERLHNEWLLERPNVIVLNGRKTPTELKEELVQVINDRLGERPGR